MKRNLATALAAFLLPICLALGAENESTENVETTVRHLLDLVAASECAFVRNGKAHSGKDASAHMEAKYRHFKEEIRTPEDFIRLATTKSLLSGKPYLVRAKDGKETNCADWMTRALKEYRQARDSGKGKEGNG